MGRQGRHGEVHGGMNVSRGKLLISWLAKKQKEHSKKQPGIICTHGTIPIDLFSPCRPYHLKVPQPLKVAPPAGDSMSKFTSLQRYFTSLYCHKILVIFIRFLCLYVSKGSSTDFHLLHWRVYSLSSRPKDGIKSFLAFIYILPSTFLLIAHMVSNYSLSTYLWGKYRNTLPFLCVCGCPYFSDIIQFLYLPVLLK